MLAGGEPNAGRGAAFHRYLADLGPIAQYPALPFDQRRKPTHQASHATKREVHAEATLEKRDKPVDRRDAERIAAHEQRMEAQRKAQPRIAHMARGKPMHAAVAL